MCVVIFVDGWRNNYPTSNPAPIPETGILVPNNQRQYRTSHAPKDVLPLRRPVNGTNEPPTRESYYTFINTTLQKQHCFTHVVLCVVIYHEITTQQVIYVRIFVDG